jgi:hypothetical protein
MNKLAPAIVALAACRSPCGHAESPVNVQTTTDPAMLRTIAKRSIILDDVPRLTWVPGKAATFAPTTVVERQAIAELVPELLAAATAQPPPDLAQLQPEAARAGMRLEIWELGGEQFWALLEAPERRRGAGAYLFRASVSGDDDHPAILLEAPHADHDIGTGEIAASLFFAPPPGGKRPRALFVNTIHRYQIEPGRRQKRADNPADAAHNPDHLFSAATEAAAAALGDVEVFQIHGFADVSDDEADDAPLPPGTEMVVSAGTKAGSSPLSTAIAAALKKAFGDGVRRFPEESGALGATTNVQGRLLAGHPGASFVHIEIAAAQRKELRASPGKLAAFGKVLLSTTGK